jgi:hypothetical protein
VRRAYVVDRFVGFDIEPAVIRKAPARKSHDLGSFAIDDRKLQVAIERCGIYHLPFHDRRCSHIELTELCDLNH